MMTGLAELPSFVELGLAGSSPSPWDMVSPSPAPIRARGPSSSRESTPRISNNVMSGRSHQLRFRAHTGHSTQGPLVDT
jgi:hypothetical protein